MSFVNFIDFNTDKDKALSIVSSAVTEFNEFNGVQLLPNNPLPYVQTTNVKGGINLEDWTASIVKCKDKPVTVLGNQNLLLHSEDVSNAVWVGTGLEYDLNAISVGSYFGDRIVATNSNSPHWITQSYVKQSGNIKYTASFYVKAAEYKSVYFRASDGSNVSIVFHFNTETQEFTNTDIDTGYTNVTRGYTDEGNGWYRVYTTFNSTEDVDLDIVIGIVDNNGDNIFVGENLNGVNVSGIYVRGFQLKEGNLSNYIETSFQNVIIPDTTTIGTDITDYFLVDRNFQDANGFYQFDWKLTNVPFDFGSELVYLKVDQLIGETFYSNKFQLTELNKEKTCRLDYKHRKLDTMQSIQVQMYFWQNVKSTEIDSYYEPSTKHTVTINTKSQKYQIWHTDFIPNFMMIKIDDVFENKFVYLNQVRSNLFEAIEIKELEHASNSTYNKIKLSTFDTDFYEPITDIANNEPPVIVEVPSITLDSVDINGSTAVYNFSYENISPNELTFQRSTGSNPWINENKGVTSPQTIAFSDTGLWYFRISHPEVISNVISIDLVQDIVAVDDSINVEQGQTQIIKPLINDVLIGSTQITNVSTPVNGTATIINNGTEIEYVHDGSNTFADLLEYTISNGMSSDVATVNINLYSGSYIGRQFNISTQGYEDKPNACLSVVNLQMYHDGFNPNPELYGYIYTDSDLTQSFNGQDKWYAISGGVIIKISNTGEVFDIDTCF